jgi:hypothetical protein
MHAGRWKNVPFFFTSWAILAACTKPVLVARRGADAPTWQTIRQVLDAERAGRPRRAWAAGMKMTMSEPHSGRTIDGRGAIAVAPGQAVRMILVGAAGTTMLDAWVTPARWRVAVPVAALIRRGRAEEPTDLPIGFLRWSFFRPLGGTLFAGSLEPGGMVFLLRDDDAVLEVRLRSCDRGKLTMTTRRARGRAERIEECRAAQGGVPRPGDWVRYEDEVSRLRVDLAFESAAPEPPDEDAFRDPDRPGLPVEVAP